MKNMCSIAENEQLGDISCHAHSVLVFFLRTPEDQMEG